MVRKYNKSKKTTRDEEPTLPPLGPQTFYEVESAIQEFIERDPCDMSSPSKRRYTTTLTTAKSLLSKANLISYKH
jgi:hypothetical protein